tara:strand:+ start:3772 stop:3915 length:144 start_codon:yes stop_codon:yes gene_type:complete
MHPETVSHSLKHDYFALVARVAFLVVELRILESLNRGLTSALERQDL